MQTNDALSAYIADATKYLKGSLRYTKVFLRASGVLDGLTHGRSMMDAPRDGSHILIETSDFGWIEGYWNADVTNFYKSQEGWSSYDPENAQGDWCSVVPFAGQNPDDRRLYCGCTPQRWLPLPPKRIDRVWRGD
ncbi:MULTISPECIES: hypothetical protein [unclassified Thalassospira]|uniref:hypothetical protein n=1 Tax=unclassified Thalassospira TaxID=2648997 RepID=UPI0007A6347A|nr:MULTISPECIES: hypothetical protein [unclassified Thalassospira]KZC99707.1 hypothetical protein AUQ41_08500 [Thalassospira sp. MCCC 1A02898]ONH85366.1 hypothetical protein TH47_05845 [Thalassospira sp. MCCC 1A02803]